MSLKIPTPLKKKEKAKIWATSHKLFICFQDLKNFQAYFIKWTTSGEPLVGLKTHQDSKLGHSAVILYIILLS